MMSCFLLSNGAFTMGLIVQGSKLSLWKTIIVTLKYSSVLFLNIVCCQLVSKHYETSKYTQLLCYFSNALYRLLCVNRNVL